MTIAVGTFSAGAFSTTGTVTTGAITTAASGSSFLGFVCDDGTTGNTPTDSKSNTYTRIGTRFTGIANCSVYLATNGTGGAGHTLTATSTGGSTDIEAYLVEITGGALASLVDAFPATQWNDDVASPFTSNSVTTTLASDLILAFTATVTTSGTETLTWGNSFTQVVADGNSAHFSGGIAQFLATSTGTFNSTFTSAGGGTAEAISTVIAFKNAAGGGVTLSLTGQTATFTEGALALNIGYLLQDGIPLAGQTATFAEGLAPSSVSYSLTGQSATFTEGSITRAASAALIGQTATFTEGTITASTGGNVTLSLSGQTASFTEGTIAGAVSYVVSGQSATFSEGTITAATGFAVSLTGQTATFTEGTIAGAASFTLGAQTTTFTEGTISASAGGAVSRSLTGQTATFTEGVITPSTSFAISLTGQTATFSEGTVASLLSLGLGSQSASFSEGLIIRSGPVTLNLSALTASFTVGAITRASLAPPVTTRLQIPTADSRNITCDSINFLADGACTVNGGGTAIPEARGGYFNKLSYGVINQLPN